MKSHIRDLVTPPLKIIGIAKEEFEAWLIADSKAVSQVVGEEFKSTKSPENMKPREAKRILENRVVKSGGKPERQRVRIEIAKECDLDVVRKKCKWGFSRFLDDLHEVCEQI